MDHLLSSSLFESFKDPHIARSLLDDLRSCKSSFTFMEVCGTHTVALLKSGIKAALPDTISLVSGPGCPVCVTPAEVVEKALGLAAKENTVLFCFGDMMRVPGNNDSLETLQAKKHARVKIMYSPMEALSYARMNPQQTVVLFGVGFETTVPLFASVLMRAYREGLTNLYVLPAFKLIPPALDTLLGTGEISVSGFLLPGHVSTIIGQDGYEYLVGRHHIAGVITGFDIVDILLGLSCLLSMVRNKQAGIKNRYSRFARSHGNQKALAAINEVFTKTDAAWRGLGTIPRSGLSLKEPFACFDAGNLIDFSIDTIPDPPECRCGDVIKGKCTPRDCRLFKNRCSPEKPVGPCMVSSEGTCAAYYKYGV